ncbi:MAG TPA: hypothetical protein VM142_12850 [Acidimicrobiales bacterium]|nr:hypothetical protein [Acidimicrobiales bacterium]
MRVLSPPASPLVGRKAETEQALGALRRTRLLTLTGPPGVGKSRLALFLAWRVLPSHPGGAIWVDVSKVPPPDLGSKEPKHSILVLDNCEHAVVDCANFAAHLVHTWPNVTVLVTSRQALGLVAEQTLSLPPLSLPDDDSPAAVKISDAVQLFCERAVVVQPEFSIDVHAPEVVAICRRLDGIPLAIELAAARLDVLSPGQILDRLHDEELDFLVG